MLFKNCFKARLKCFNKVTRVQSFNKKPLKVIILSIARYILATKAFLMCSMVPKYGS